MGPRSSPFTPLCLLAPASLSEDARTAPSGVRSGVGSLLASEAWRPSCALPHTASAPSLPLFPSFSFPFLPSSAVHHPLYGAFSLRIQPGAPTQPHLGDPSQGSRARPLCGWHGFSWYGLWLPVSFKTKIKTMKILSISGVFWGRLLWGTLGRWDRTSLLLFLEMV